MITKIKAVRVQEVIMSGSPNVIGNIRFNEINESTPISTKQLQQARPLFNNISHYPTVNEIVYILGGPKANYNSIGSSICFGLSTSTTSSGDGGLLTEEEMNQLMDVAEEISKTVEEPKQIELPNDN